MTKFIFFLLFLTSFAISQDYKKGILIQPVKEGKVVKIEAGQLIEYRPSPTSEFDFDIKLVDTIYTEVFDCFTIPYDFEFTPSRILLELLNERYYNYSEQIRTKCNLAKSSLELFPNHYLNEEIHAQYCIYSKICREYPDGVKTNYNEIIKIFSDFLLKYPSSRYIDQFKWQIVQMENHWYEFEGYASGPISQVKAYERFLKNNLDSEMVDVIKIKCAKLYRIAFECIVHQPEENEHDGFSFSDAEKFIQAAMKYYTELLSSSDVKLRETARVALYNIKNNNTTYVGSSDW